MVVVDASVWVSYTIPQDVHHAASRAWARPYVLNGGRMVVPSIIIPEVAGAVARATNDNALGQAAVARLLRLAGLTVSPTFDVAGTPRRNAPIRIVRMDYRLALAAAEIAIHHRIKGADSVYVAVADRLGVPLVSWDNEQLDRSQGRIVGYTPATAP